MDKEHYRKLCEEYCRQREEGHQKFSPYLVATPDDFVKAKMATFEVAETAPNSVFPIFLCGIRNKVFLHPKKTIDLSIVETEPYTHYVQPRTLEHAKQLVGVPNEVHRTARKAGSSCECSSRWKVQMDDIRQLDTSDKPAFEEYDGKQRAALHRASLGLLHGYVDEGMVEKAPYKQISDYILRRLAKVPTFVGNDLVVCEDEEVEFKGYAAVYFNNVVVFGNGRINLGNNTKLHAYQIRHA